MVPFFNNMVCSTLYVFGCLFLNWSSFLINVCCFDWGIPFGARANKKLFSMECIAAGGSAYAHISQKILKGAASRLFIYWLAPILVSHAQQEGASRVQLHSGCIQVPLNLFYFGEWIHMCTISYCLFLCLGLRHMANLFLALTTIHTTLASNGKFGFDQQYCAMDTALK